MTPYQLFERGASTLVASWAEYARGTSGASVRRVPGATVAVFADEPERVVYNNTLMDLGLDAAGREAAVSAMEEAYAGEGIEHFAAWVHENDAPLRADLEGRGYGVTESTRAMGIALEDLDLPRPDLDLVPADWHDYVAMIGLGPDFQRYADPAAYVVRVARLDGEAAAVAMAYDHDGDRGIYSVTTLRARPPAGARHGPDDAAAARGPRRGLHDGDPPVHADGGADLRVGRLPRPGAVPRARAGRTVATLRPCPS